MRLFAFILVLALAACSTTPSIAMPSDRMELARRYAKLLSGPGVFEAIYTTYIDEIRVRFPSYANKCVYDPDPTNCRRIVALAAVDVSMMLDEALEDAVAYREALAEADAQTYGTLYSVEELQANIAFFESPMGRSTLSKAPALAKGLAENQYNVLRPWFDELEARMAEILASYGYVVEQPPDDI